MKRILKRTLSVVLTIVMCLTCLPGDLQAAPANTAEQCSGNWTDYTSEVTPTWDESAGYYIYEISTAEELAWVANGVNTFVTESPALIKLKSDIDLSAHYWIPISKDYNHRFTDVFDGNGHTITGMYIGSVSSQYDIDNNCGLFGYLNGCVKNLKITDALIYAKGQSGTASTVGVLAGQVDGADAVVKNCEVEGSLHSIGTSSSKYINNGAIGGIAGCLLNGAVIDSCRSNTSVGILDGTKYYALGGVAGVAGSSTTQDTVIIKNSVSTINITLANDTDVSHILSDAVFASGKKCSVINSIGVGNYGSAAVADRSADPNTITRTNVCYAETNFNKKVDDSYELQAASYSYYDGTGAVSEMSQDDMKTASFVETLNSAAANIDGALEWSIADGVNDGYPNLADAKVCAGGGDTPVTTYTVTFISKGESYKTQSIESGKTVDKPEDPNAGEGNTFLYWYADDEDVEYDFATPITGDLTLTAKWKCAKYSVLFDSLGGSYVYPQKLDKGQKAAMPETPTKKGYSFGGWYADKTYTSAWNFDSAVTKNTTLYAKWNKVENVSISGRITDSKTGLGIRNADVTLSNGSNAATDEFGYYRIENVSQGSYTIIVTANSYNSASEEGFEVGETSTGFDVALTKKSGAENSTVNVYATISCVYSGIMLDGVQVKAVGEGNLGTYTETTKDGGLAYFTGLPAGNYTFYVNQTGRKGWESYTSTKKTLSGDYQLNCALKPNYQELKINVLGSYDPVTNKANIPLSGKEVKLTGVDPNDEDNELISINAYTDSKGTVTVKKLVPVTWKVSCSDFAYEETETFVYSDGSGKFSEDEVTLTLPFVDSSVSVSLSSVYSDPDFFKKTDENKNSLPDVSLTGIVGTMTEGVCRSAKPDESGKIVFTGLFPGNYNVNVSGKIERYVDILSADNKEIFDQTDNVAEQDFSRFGRKHFSADIQGTGTASVALGAKADATVEVTPTPVNFSGTLFKKDMDENGDITTTVCANTKIIIKPSDYYKQSGDNADGLEITTDTQGHYSATLAPGLYGVEVESKYNDYFGGHLVYREGHPNGYKGSWGWPCTGKWTGSKASAVAWMTSDESLAYGDIGGMGLSSGTVIADLEMMEKKVSYSAGSPGSSVAYTSYKAGQYLITDCTKDKEKTAVNGTNDLYNYDYYDNTYTTVDFHPETWGASIKIKGAKTETVTMTGKTFPVTFNDLDPGDYSLEYTLSNAFSQLDSSVPYGGEISFFDFPAPGKLPASFPEDYAEKGNPWPLSAITSALRIDPKTNARTFEDLIDQDESNGELNVQFYKAKTYSIILGAEGGANQNFYDSWPGKYGTGMEGLHWRWSNGEVGTESDGVYREPLDGETLTQYNEYLDNWGYPKAGAWMACIEGTYKEINDSNCTYHDSEGWDTENVNKFTLMENYLVAYSTSAIPDKLFRYGGTINERRKPLPGGTVTLYFCAPQGQGYKFVRGLNFVASHTNYPDLYDKDLWFSVTLNNSGATECKVNFINPSESSSSVKILSSAEVKNLLKPRTIKVVPVENGDMDATIDDVDVTITYAGINYSSTKATSDQTVTGSVTEVKVAADEYEWECMGTSYVRNTYDDANKIETFYVPVKRKLYPYDILVKDSDGNVVKGASVRLDPSSHGEPVYMTTSSNGSANVIESSGLTYQNYTLTVSADGYAPKSDSVTKDNIKDGTKKIITLSKAEQPTFVTDSVTLDRKGAFIPGVSFVGSSNSIEFLTNLGSGDLYYTVTAQVDTVYGDSVRDIFIADKKAFKNPDCSDVPEAIVLPGMEGSSYNPSAALEWVDKLKSGALGTVYYRPLYDDEGFTYKSVLNGGGYHYEFSHTMPLWELPPDGFEPCIVAVTSMGAVQIYSIDYSGNAAKEQLVGLRLSGDYAMMLNNITLMANAKAVGGKAVEKLAELTEPTGSIIPLPSFESGIELDDDGYLDYSYTIEMQLLQGKQSVSDAKKAYTSILPSTLGIVVAGGWNMELDGKEHELSNSYDVKVAGEDMDALDYLPSAFKALPVSIGFDEDNPPTGKFTLEKASTFDKDNNNVTEAYSFGANGQVHINAEVSAFSSFGAVLPVGPVLASLEKSGALDIGAQVKVAVGADGTYTYTIENGNETSHDVTFTIGAGAGIGMYAKAFGGALGAEANLKLSGDNDKLEDMVTVSATVDKDGFRLNTLDGKVVADAHIEIDTWFINGEKDFTFAEIPFSYQFGTVTQFTLTPINVKDTIKSRNDFDTSVFNGKPETVVSNFLPIGGYATDEDSKGTFIYTDMSAKGGNVRLMLAQSSGVAAWSSPVVVASTDGLIPAFDVITLGNDKYMVVWTEIAKVDMQKTCPPSAVKYAIGDVSSNQWKGTTQTLALLPAEVASKLMLVSDKKGISLVALKTAEGALAEKWSIGGYRYDGASWSGQTELANNQALYDMSACSVNGNVMVSYVTDDKKLHALKWSNSISQEQFDVCGFESAIAADDANAYLISETDNGLALNVWNGSWANKGIVADASNPGNVTLDATGQKIAVGWTGDNDHVLYTAISTKDGKNVSDIVGVKKAGTGRFSDSMLVANSGKVQILTVLDGDTNRLNAYAVDAPETGGSVTAPDNPVTPNPEPDKPTPNPAATDPTTEAPTQATTESAEPISAGTKLTDESTKATFTVTSETGEEPEVTYTGSTKSKEKALTIPDTVTVAGTTYKVTAIAADTFKNNTTITSVVIGKNIEVIEDGAFSGCKKLKKATIGSGVREIGAKAFANCNSLTKVTIPANVSKIGAQAFSGDKKLKTITIKTTKLTAKNVSKNAFKGITNKTVIRVPKKKLKAYKKLFRKKGLSKKVKIKS